MVVAVLGDGLVEGGGDGVEVGVEEAVGVALDLELVVELAGGEGAVDDVVEVDVGAVEELAFVGPSLVGPGGVSAESPGDEEEDEEEGGGEEEVGPPGGGAGGGEVGGGVGDGVVHVIAALG